MLSGLNTRLVTSVTSAIDVVDADPPVFVGVMSLAICCKSHCTSVAFNGPAGCCKLMGVVTTDERGGGGGPGGGGLGGGLGGGGDGGGNGVPGGRVKGDGLIVGGMGGEGGCAGVPGGGDAIGPGGGGETVLMTTGVLYAGGAPGKLKLSFEMPVFRLTVAETIVDKLKMPWQIW